MMVHSNAFVFARARFRENGEGAGVRPQALLPGTLAATVEAKGARLGQLFRMKSNRGQDAPESEVLRALFRRREKLNGFGDGLGQPGLFFRCKRQKLHPGFVTAEVLHRRNLLCGAIVHGAGRRRELEAQKLSDRQDLLRLDRAAAFRNTAVASSASPWALAPSVCSPHA